MSLVKNLIFYDKEGYPLNLQYNDTAGYWEGAIHIDQISIGLYNNESIHVFQKALVDGNNVLTTPFTDNSTTNLEVTWETNDGDSPPLFFFDYTQLADDVATINQKTSLSLATKAYMTVDENGGEYTIPTNYPQPLSIHVAVKSEYECVTYNNVLIKYGSVIVAKIEVYGEVVAPDERLGIMISNLLGRNITSEEELIFRDSDVNEDKPDYRLIDRKRKEMLLEHHNIFPYLASYRGIINILKFFGYFDLVIKEWWLDTNTGKYELVPVIIDEYDKLDDKNNTKRYPYKKTALFSLHYMINMRVDGEFDEFGIPIMKKNFQYSNDEILIKLFALAQWIAENNVGGISRIIDIVGEAEYFERYDFNNWETITPVIDINQPLDCSFKVSNPTGTLGDLRLLDLETQTLGADSKLSDIGSDQLADIGHHVLSHFAPYNRSDDLFFEDDPELAVVGYNLDLVNTTDAVDWYDLNLRWTDIDNYGGHTTWNNVQWADFYDIQWRARKRMDDNSNSVLEVTTREPITTSNYGSGSLIIKEPGVYTPTMVLHGYGNNDSVCTQVDAINVDINLEIIAFFKPYLKIIQSWQSNLLWTDMSWSWASVGYKPNNTYIDDYHYITDRTMNNAAYVDDSIVDDVYSGFDTLRWNDLPNDMIWTDLEYTSWADLSYRPTNLGQARITSISGDATLTINDTTYDFGDNFNGTLGAAASDLTSYASTNAVFGNFYFIARPIDNPKYVDIVTKSEDDTKLYTIGMTGCDIDRDFLLVKWSTNKKSWNELNINWVSLDNAKCLQSKPDYYRKNHIEVSMGSMVAPKLVPIVFTTDPSGMRGKKEFHWKIYNENTVIHSIQTRRLIYRFLSSGVYDIEVTVTDNIGNRATKRKRGFIRIVDVMEYENLRTR